MKPFVRILRAATLILASLALPRLTDAQTVFSTDFNSGLPTQFSALGAGVESVQGYAGVGTGTNTFSVQFLRNPTIGSEAVLSLSGLPAHTGVELNFLLAIIDTWDGTSNPANELTAPDFFNVSVDGITVFSKIFDNQDSSQQTYLPPTGVQLDLRPFPDRGFQIRSDFGDAAYDMGLDPVFHSIPHTASTLTIRFFASGSGYQGGTDESWAIDNVSVNLVPGLSGDYNFDGTIDAADYVLWRKTDGTPAGYNAWRTHFGQPSGSGVGVSATAAIPEPTAIVLLMLAAAGWCLRRGRPA